MLKDLTAGIAAKEIPLLDCIGLVNDLQYLKPSQVKDIEIIYSLAEACSQFHDKYLWKLLKEIVRGVIIEHYHITEVVNRFSELFIKVLSNIPTWWKDTSYLSKVSVSLLLTIKSHSYNFNLSDAVIGTQDKKIEPLLYGALLRTGKITLSDLQQIINKTSYSFLFALTNIINPTPTDLTIIADAIYTLDAESNKKKICQSFLTNPTLTQATVVHLSNVFSTLTYVQKEAVINWIETLIENESFLLPNNPILKEIHSSTFFPYIKPNLIQTIQNLLEK